MNLILKAIKVIGLKSTDFLISYFCFLGSVMQFSRKLPPGELSCLQSLRHEQIIDLILKNFSYKEIEILDAGCGRGELLKKLREKEFTRLYGFDFHPREINWAEFRQMDIIDLKADTYDRGFDVIILSEVLEHLENPALALRALKKFLNNDGIIVVTIPNSMSVWERIYYLLTCNFRRYKKEKPGEYGHISIFTEATLGSLSSRASLTVSKSLGGVMFLNGYLFFDGRTVTNNWSYHSTYLLRQT